MFDKLKQFNQWLRQKPIFLVVIFVVLALLIIPFGKTKKKTAETPSTIRLKALNPSSAPETTFDQLSLNRMVKKIDVYQISSPSQNQIDHLFNPIVQEFNFSKAPEKIDINQVPNLFWNNAPNFLTVNLQSGAFTLDFHPRSMAAGSKLAEIDAANIAKNWLIKYQLIAENTQFQAAPIEDKIGDSYQDSSRPNWQIYFYPTLNDLPIFTPNSVDAPISVIVTSQGNLYSVYYRLPPVLFTKAQIVKTANRSILSNDQVQQAIKDKKPTITRIAFPNGRFASSNTNLKIVNYNKIVLGYSNEITNSQLLPIFQLTGTAQLDSGEIVTVTAYLPALAE